jgi:serine protease Do
LGVSINDVTAEDAEVYDLPSVSGILVQSVTAGGPADGQLEREDVIVALDGQPVGYVAELQARIAQQRPGDRVTVTLYRNRRAIDVELRLDEAPINEIETVVAERAAHAEERLGINVETMDVELAQMYRFERAGGVILTQVARGSPAARRGVERFVGTRLVQVQDRSIATPDDVRLALDAVDGGQIVSLHFEDTQGAVSVVNLRMPN